jgi:outer membrane lipoprotein-sorting protein
MYNLFDLEADQTLVAGLKEHLLQCPSCANDYRDMENVLSMLKPRLQPSASFLLKQNIINHLSKEEHKMTEKISKTIKLNSATKKILSIAAVLVLIMLIIPFIGKNDGFMNSTAKAANSFLKSSIDATRLVKSMVMKLKVRTIARDNFSLVGTKYGMVDHTIWKLFEKPEKWRIDKGERIVVFDGKNQYLWIPEFKEGIKAGRNAGFIEWFKILIDPESILLKEQASTKDKDSKFTMDEKDGELYMTIISKARGNFINDYCKNKSIEESDNRREYTFDSNTKLLKGLKIYILDMEKETLILETEKIDYNISIDPAFFTITLPKGVEWKELSNNIKSETFNNITSKRAAELIFDAMAKNNWDSIKDVWPLFNRITMPIIKKNYGGLEVIKIGESFKSGLYKGEFVPYEVKLPDGTIKKHNIALRNDNKNRVWIVDGGL